MDPTDPTDPRTGQRFLVARDDLRQSRVVPDPDAPAQRPLAEGQARLRIDRFALTANNITYAVFGEAMKYWQFFPTDDPAWGCIPVWGFAEVLESRAEGVAAGERLYGCFPMGTHLVVQPARVDTHGFVDDSAHRCELPAVYNRLVRCAADPGCDAAREAQQALLQPLFTTAFLIDDFLAEQGFFGARQLLLSSASSKTACATAFCLAQRRGGADAVRVIGLSSPANRDFAAALGCWDEVRAYDALATLDAAVPTLYVDFAGNAALRRAVHEHFADRLRHSASVGGTHWDALGAGAGLPGPRPVLFFAPGQLARRSAPPPQGWGATELQRRLALSWRAFVAAVDNPAAPWLRVEQGQGAEAVRAAVLAQLDGRVDPRSGQMLRL
jgi:hypothetical protein